MKRGREDEDGVNDADRPAKRRPLPHSLPITSPDKAAVKETYHTDCEIVATGGEEPHRVFPVNRVIIGSWSEPFRVMANGKFAEGINARIELPYAVPVVELAVQHMYFLAHFTDEFTVPPEHSFALMQLAHMYDQRELFNRCVEPLWESNTFNTEQVGDPATLRLMLSMGLAVRDVTNYFCNSKVTFPPFSIDVNDEVLKPFVRELCLYSLRSHTRVIFSEYTEEQRIANIYIVFYPEQFVQMKERRLAKIAAGEDPRIAERHARALLDTMEHAQRVHCGVLSEEELRANLDAERRRLRRDPGLVADISAVLADPNVDLRTEYESLMREIYPLPGMPGHPDNAPAAAAAEEGGAA